MAPTTRDYIAADFIAWGQQGAGARDARQLQTYIDRAASQDSSLKNWTPFAISSELSPAYATSGLYADAFKIGSGQNAQIVIAFQGSKQENEAQRNADFNILINNTSGLEQAVTQFINAVWQKAQSEPTRIPASQIFVTGHSLGARKLSTLKNGPCREETRSAEA